MELLELLLKDLHIILTGVPEMRYKVLLFLNVNKKFARRVEVGEIQSLAK